eukprot:Filipodium_phascolosomae@DN2900_c0_g1_i1.p1
MRIIEQTWKINETCDWSVAEAEHFIAGLQTFGQSSDWKHLSESIRESIPWSKISADDCKRFYNANNVNRQFDRFVEASMRHEVAAVNEWARDHQRTAALD